MAATVGCRPDTPATGTASMPPPAAAMPAPPASSTDTPASASPLTAPDTALVQKIRSPRRGDVYVVAYQPAGSLEERYFFYRVSKAGPKSVDLLPARQESTDPQADVSAAGFFTDKALTYTRAEALELMQEQPGDVQHTHLIRIRRESEVMK
ncbi:hypothetical protein CDA63_10370 [Hymenobacter amundsenii]|uniref:Uncharacterized protein n=1 Tax=Hymenobacter amundsenii TaxID=2006685 RepID=A0A2D0AFW4_9BACT|nr:hypothetical protein CDA63_10370 [Hymenobacter amundsenii]